MKYFYKKIKNKSAQAMIEFCLAIPVLICVIGVMLACSQLVYMKQVAMTTASTGLKSFCTNGTNSMQQSPNGPLLTNNNFDYEFNHNGTSQGLNLSNRPSEVLLTKTYDMVTKMVDSADFNIKFKNLNIQVIDANQYILGASHNFTIKNSGRKMVKVSVALETNTLLPIIYNGDKLTSKLVCVEQIIGMLEK